MSKARQVAERVRRYVRENHEFVELKTANFLWHHEPNREGRWLNECLVVLPHEIDQAQIAKLGLNELSSSAGADSSDWLDHPASNAEFLFGRLLGMAWLSDEERIEAITEFAKVRELGWARGLLHGFAYECGAFTDTEEGSLNRPMQNIYDVEEFRDELLRRYP